MENENNIKKRIDELKITEEDLYILSHIEGIKATAGIFKEKYNKYMYGILKKNNVNSIDFLMISRYVKNKKFHLVPELIEKYGPYQLDSSKTSYDFKGMKAFATVLIVIIIVFFVFKQTNNSSKSNSSIPNQSVPSAPTESEKKLKCLRMFGGGDMYAWETAQAECMLNNSQSACDCMVILSK
jgi:hypothetical protein